MFTIYFSQLKFELNLGPSFSLFYSIFKVRRASFVKRLIMVTSVLRFVNGLFSSIFLSIFLPASTPEAAGYLWLCGSLICLPDIEFIVRTQLWQLLFLYLSSFFRQYEYDPFPTGFICLFMETVSAFSINSLYII